MKPERRSGSTDSLQFLDKLDSVILSLQSTPLRPRKLASSSIKAPFKPNHQIFSTEEMPRKPSILAKTKEDARASKIASSTETDSRRKVKYNVLRHQCVDMIDKIGRCSMMIDKLESKCKLLKNSIRPGIDNGAVMADLKHSISIAKKIEKKERLNIIANSLSTTPVLSRSLSKKLLRPKFSIENQPEKLHKNDPSPKPLQDKRRLSTQTPPSKDKESFANLLKHRVSTLHSSKPSTIENISQWKLATKKSKKIVM